MKDVRRSLIAARFVVCVLVVLPALDGCDRSPSAALPTAPLPTAAPTAPTVPPALRGSWNGSITDWQGTARATLILQAGGEGSMVYEYEGLAVADWRNVTSGGRVTLKSANDPSTVSFSFTSPNNLGHQGPFCWAGDFQGTLISLDTCTKQLIGNYQMRGWSEDCFSPPRTGTFSFLADQCD
jgi:hypothetical protein